MTRPSTKDIAVTNAFKEGISMLDLAIEHDTTYMEIQEMIRRVMIEEGVYQR